MKKADAILTADIHLREDIPVCRTDDYQAAQWKKLGWLAKLQLKHDCPILVAGDLFHHWKPSPHLLFNALTHLPERVSCVAGNHDLPQHSLDLFTKCGIAVLEQADRIHFMREGFSYFVREFPFSTFWLEGVSHGEENKKLSNGKDSRSVALMHVMTYKSKAPYPGCTADNATMLLRRMKGFDLVVTGDNHEPFTVEHKGRLLVNPGSMMRMTAAQVKHRPRVYLWYAEDNTAVPAYFPIEEGVVSREHIEHAEARDARIEAFVSRLKDDVEIGLSFETNLKKFFAKNKTKKAIRDIVWEAVQNEQ